MKKKDTFDVLYDHDMKELGRKVPHCSRLIKLEGNVSVNINIYYVSTTNFIFGHQKSVLHMLMKI